MLNVKDLIQKNPNSEQIQYIDRFLNLSCMGNNTYHFIYDKIRNFKNNVFSFKKRQL